MKAIMPIFKLIEQKFFDKPNSRQDILNLEQWIRNMKTCVDASEYHIDHKIVDGMYTRTMHVPAGHIICGKIHKKDYLITLLKGIIWVTSEYGARELVAPMTFKAKAGVKNIGFILKDVVWIDTHRVNTNNIEEAEKEIFAISYEEYDDYQKILQGESLCQA